MNINNLINQIRPEYEFGDVLPEDLQTLINTLANLGLETNVPTYWSGSSIIDRFINKWEDDKANVKHDDGLDSNKIFSQAGKAIKLLHGWDYLSLCLIEEKGSPLELLIETSNDLECSAYLAGEGFLKQSLQIIRNYCESCVSIIYFFRNKVEFQEWIENKTGYYFPDYQKMLGSIERHSIISPIEKNTLRNAYKELNGSVHNKRNRLNMSIRNIENTVNTFGLSDYDEWSNVFIENVSFMMSLYVKLWENRYWKQKY